MEYNNEYINGQHIAHTMYTSDLCRKINLSVDSHKIMFYYQSSNSESPVFHLSDCTVSSILYKTYSYLPFAILEL